MKVTIIILVSILVSAMIIMYALWKYDVKSITFGSGKTYFNITTRAKKIK